MRYLYYTAHRFKTPDQFVIRFKACLNEPMRRRFPRMFLGKDAGRISGGFTVILAKDEFEAPGEAEFLRNVNLSYVGEADFDEVEKWAVDPDRVLDFARLARFLKPEPLAADDPFAASDAGVAKTALSVKYDNLFAWLCATGQGTYDTFRRTAIALDLPVEDGSARALLRRLRVLGHVEVSEDGQRWFVTPPTVVQLDDGSGYFLAGARDTRVIEALEGTALRCGGQVSVDRHEAREAPRAVRITGVTEAEIVGVLTEAVDAAGAAGAAARRLAEALPHIDHAQALFSRVYHPNIHAFELALYDANSRDYKDVSGPSRTGLYRLRSGRSNDGPDRTLLYLRDEDAWYRGDWYGLRFVARHAAGERCMLGYDPRVGEVAIAKDWHLPELYERALVLASGMLARNDKDLLVYSGVTRETLDILVQKLNAIVEVKTHA